MVAHKVKPFPWIREGSPLFGLSQSCAFIMAANWVMQGMRGMDRGELLFRWLLFFITASLMIRAGLSPITSFVAAHTLNFALNGHPWVCLRYCAFYRRSPAAIECWLDRWCARLERMKWLEEVVIIGSRAKRLCAARSDIDLRVISGATVQHWVFTNLLMLAMRTDALFHRIPLDLYAYDRPQSLRRFDQGEPMAIVLDRNNRLRMLFQDRQLVNL